VTVFVGCWSVVAGEDFMSSDGLLSSVEGMDKLGYNVNWLKVLTECSDNVEKSVKPYLKAVSAPQPNLGVGAGGDPIKLVDLAAEKAIIQTFLSHGVSFTLVSEDSGVKEFGNAPGQVHVTIDPVDGTTNFMHGLPFYATSIAVSSGQRLSTVYAALVADLVHHVMYTAKKGEGAFRNGEGISPSQTTMLAEAVVGLDLNTYKVKELAPKLNSLIAETKHIRHFGANALELCYVADGKTDAFVDIRGKLRTTDVAAGFLILMEAGGVLTTPEGEALDTVLDPKQTVKFIAAGNRKIHSTILEKLKT